MSHEAIHSIDDAVEKLYNLNIGFVGTPEGGGTSTSRYSC